MDDYEGWLANFDTHQVVRRVWLAESDKAEHKLVVKGRTKRDVLRLLAKGAGYQFEGDKIEQVVLDEKYPVQSLVGKNGVYSKAFIPKGSAVAIYEGSFVPPGDFIRKSQNQHYIVNVVADECLPNDPEWEDERGIRGICYGIDPIKGGGNLSMYINDAKDHPQSLQNNVKFLTFTTDQCYPLVAIVATQDIPPQCPVLIDYGRGFLWNQ